MSAGKRHRRFRALPLGWRHGCSRCATGVAERRWKFFAFQNVGDGLVEQFVAACIRIDDVGGFQRGFTAEQTFYIVGRGLRFDVVDDLMHLVV